MPKILEPIGVRLREERLRLFKSIKDLSIAAGAHRNSIENYESGATPINVAMLLVLQDLGFDIGYVVTGRRTDGDLGFADSEILRLVSLLSRREREAVVALVSTLAGETVSLSDIGASSRTMVHEKMPTFTAKPEDI